MAHLLSRRHILIGGLAAGIGSELPIWRAYAETGALPLFAGTYNGPTDKGLHTLNYNAGREIAHTGKTFADIENASFGVFSRRFGHHYLIDETDNGSISTYRVGRGSWTCLDKTASQGRSPCHVALDGRQNHLAVANYRSGTVGFFRLDPKTGVPVLADIRKHEGQGPNPSRQKSPHAHWVGFSPDDRFLYSVDLGADRIFVCPFDAETGKIGPDATAFAAPPGSGPRHLAFHPRLPLAYLVSELANTLTVLEHTPDGTLRPVQSLSTLPTPPPGPSQAAHIALNRAANRLYVSNRGQDSIAVFAIGGRGMAAPLQYAATASWPRQFLLLESAARVIVACEKAGTLETFHIRSDGTLADRHRLTDIPRVVFAGIAL